MAFSAGCRREEKKALAARYSQGPELRRGELARVDPLLTYLVPRATLGAVRKRREARPAQVAEA
jgi:hypothetical protein